MQKILRLVPSKLYYQVGIITNEPAILDAVKHYHIAEDAKNFKAGAFKIILPSGNHN